MTSPSGAAAPPIKEERNMTVRRILIPLSLVVGWATPSLAADRAPALTNLAHLD
jgi:hypothetical protein